MLYDLVRYLDFAMFGIGTAFMVLTNILAFKVLRPPQKLGFLWWHVTAISVSFLCLGTVSLNLVFVRLGEEPTWRSPVTFIGLLLFMTAQIIIFYVESQRYASSKIVDTLASKGV